MDHKKSLDYRWLKKARESRIVKINELRNSNDGEPLEKIEELTKKGKEKYESRLDKEVDEQEIVAGDRGFRDGADDGQGCAT